MIYKIVYLLKLSSGCEGKLERGGERFSEELHQSSLIYDARFFRSHLL